MSLTSSNGASLRLKPIGRPGPLSVSTERPMDHAGAFGTEVEFEPTSGSRCRNGVSPLDAELCRLGWS